MTTLHTGVVAVFAAIALVLAAGCGDEETGTVVDVAEEQGNLTVLVEALDDTELDEELAATDLVTVMAPDDDAFARLPEGVMSSLEQQPLSDILLYHFIPDEVTSSEIAELDRAPTLFGADMTIAFRGDTVILNGITKVTATDIMADNGVIHVLDSVMLPPDMTFPGTLIDVTAAYPTFDPLVGALFKADLIPTLSTSNEGNGYTVFAPTDAAFAELGIDVTALDRDELRDILLYHVVDGTVDAEAVTGLSEATTVQGGTIDIESEGGRVLLNGEIEVVRTDLRAQNGIIHVIDGVLLPE